MVTLENVKDLSVKAKMSQTAFDASAGTGAQVAGINVGEELSVDTLLYLTMVHSACDACEVLAEFVGGTKDNFVKMMNDWVKKSAVLILILQIRQACTMITIILLRVICQKSHLKHLKMQIL